MNNTMITSSEKQFFGKVGKVYGKVAKAMLFFLVASLIMTGIAAAAADPSVAHTTVKSGQTMYMSPFYVDDARTYQFFFGIENIDYQAQYDTNHDNEVSWNEYSSQMEWKVQLVVQYSESRSFSSYEKVADISGEINMVEVSLQPGFHRIVLTNLDQTDLQLVAGHAHVNLGLIIATAVFWAIFGIIVGLFAFMVHIGVWILIIYAILKLVYYLNEDNKPQGIIYPQYATSTVQQQPPQQEEL